MFNETVEFEIQQTYDNLRASLIERGARVLSETIPSQIVVEQGSLWGIMPVSAKKTIDLTLQPQGPKTLVTSLSRLAKDWKNITLLGCVLALVLIGTCVWMAIDLSAFIVDGNTSFWSWLVTTRGVTEFSVSEAFVNLVWGLAVFLSIIVALEIAVYFNCRSKVEAFSKEVIGALV
jgi:hypothetical protein